MKVDWVPVAKLLELQRRQVQLDPLRVYQEIGVRSFGRGLFIKQPLTGQDLGDKRVYEVRAGDFVVSNVFAWEGAIGLASEEHDGLIGSHRFMTWTPVDESLDLNYLRAYFQSNRGVRSLSEASPGSAGRNRTLSIKAFEGVRVPIPRPTEQHRIAAHLDALESRMASTLSPTASETVLAGALPRLLGDLLRSSSLPWVPLSALASNRQVVIHPGDDLRGASAFIGLEHVESHTGRAVGKRAIDNEKGRKLLFRPGQVTYGYLRPYLNKAWVADRVGLCSVEQFVLEPSTGVDPRVLSMVLRSDLVWDAAKDATNGLQLPRVSLKKLLAFEVPDVRALPSASAIIAAGERVEDLVVRIDRGLSDRRRISSAVLPAARNELFNAMH